MRKVNLSYYEVIESNLLLENAPRYRVALGNNTVKYFHSTRHTKRYLSEVNRYLTFRLHDFNMIHSQLYCIYRSNWFYFRNIARELPVSEKLRDCEKSFERTCSRLGEKANHFIFIDLRSLSDTLEQVAMLLKNMSQKRNAHSEAYDIECIRQRIVKLREEIFSPEFLETVKVDEPVQLEVVKTA